MSRCWDYDDVDPYWRHRMQEAEEAMNDREVGLLGQCQAAREYDAISRKLGLYSDSPSCETRICTQIMEAEEQKEDKDTVPKFSRGLPIISW